MLENKWTCDIQYPRVDSSVFRGNRMRRSLPPKIEKRRNIEHQVKKPKKWSEMDEYEREAKFADYLGWVTLIMFFGAILLAMALSGEVPDTNPFRPLYEK
jgi:hypothetical protein